MTPEADDAVPRPNEAKPAKHKLATALGAAAEAGKDTYDTGEIAADDVGASKLSIEVDRQRKLPTGKPPGEGEA